MSIYDDFEKNSANYAALSPLSFIKRTALMFPDRDAVIYGSRNYSWSQLYKRSIQLASALNKNGVGKGDTVAILAANTPEMIEAHFGIPMSGAILNTINTRLDTDTISYILVMEKLRFLLLTVNLPLRQQMPLKVEIYL